MVWLLVPDGLVHVIPVEMLISWDFPKQPTLGFTEKGQKKRKYPVNRNSLKMLCCKKQQSFRLTGRQL